MNFVVEDGTGKSDATSYVSVADYKQYWIDKGLNSSEYSEAQDETIQGYLNQATDYIDSNYDFIGTPTDADTQALEWPRYVSHTGIQRKIIDSDEITAFLVKAVSFLALEVKNNGQLEQSESTVISESYGGVSKTYSKAGNPKRYKYVDKLLSNFLIAGAPLQRVN